MDIGTLAVAALVGAGILSSSIAQSHESAPSLNRPEEICDSFESMQGRAGKLIVVVPGSEATIDDWTDLLQFMRHDDSLALSNAGILCYDHHLGYFSAIDPTRVARDIASTIEANWEAMGRPPIVLAGHSAGALLVRASHLIALGSLAGEVTPPLAWPNAVERMVLLAGVGRGGSRSPFIRSLDRAVQAVPGVSSSTFVGQQLLRGAPFLSNLRLSTIAAFADTATAANRPPIIHLIGTDDKVVGESDNVDLIALPNAVQIHVPRATHGDIIQVTWTSNDEVRRSKIRFAMTVSKDSLRRMQQGTRRAAMGLPPMDSAAQSARPVYVLMHGIRSSAYGWPREMSDSLVRLGVNANEIFRPHYGYFSLWNYVAGSTRESEVYRFLDEYVAFRARFPTRPVVIVAHSFGTYVVANAIRRVPALTAKAVVLVGTVLPSTFPWDEISGRGQVGRIFSVAGEDDIPVGFASAAASGFPRSTVGSAAIQGFIGTSVVQCGWTKGGHSAPLEGLALNSLASSLAPTVGDRLCPVGTRNAPNGRLSTLSRVMPPVGTAVFWGGAAGTSAFIINGRTPTQRWQRAGWITATGLTLRVILGAL